MSAPEVLLTSAQTGGRFGLVRSTMTRDAATPRHLHHWDDEIVFVLAGEIAVLLDGTWRRAAAGEALFLPRGIEHALAAETTSEVLTFLAPAGYEEHHHAGPQGDGVERAVVTAARHGCEITGPPVRPAVRNDERRSTP